MSDGDETCTSASHPTTRRPPDDAYINFMNVLDNIRTRAGE